LLSFADCADLAGTAAEQTTSMGTYMAQGTGKSEDWIIEADPIPSYEWFY
jgi:hypothetical protein